MAGGRDHACAGFPPPAPPPAPQAARTKLDRLSKLRNPARKAFLSELLCLEYPDLYPVLNNPVQQYLSDIGLKCASGASEGARYLDIALKLRVGIAQNPRHPAKAWPSWMR